MPLTKRQTQIVQLMAQGNTAEQCAAEMCRSVGTVRRHVVLACDRVNARNVTHLVAKAVSQGWIAPLCLMLALTIAMDAGTDKMRVTARVRLTRTTTRLEC